MAKNKVGRPKQDPTTVIRVPVARIRAVENVLGRKIDSDQPPHIMVRVPVAQVGKIRKAIENG